MIRANKLEQYIERCEGKDRPITAEIFLTDYCNLRCGYCRYANNSGDYMMFTDFVAYVTRLVQMGVRGVILTGGGEPTVNPWFGKITEWLERNGIPYGINTNLAREVLCKPNFIKVSIEAGTRERYKEIRGRDALDNVLHNLQKLIEYKRRSGSKTTIGVQCVAGHSVEDVKSFYDVVKDYDVDYIYVRPLETCGRHGLGVDEVRAVLPPDDKRIALSFKWGLLDYQPSWCVANWSVITVDVHGDVPYCCHRPTEIVGHVLDLNIMRRKAEHHVDMRACERPCRLSGANKYLEEADRELDANFV